jgi:hypothetical protein
VSVSSRVQHVIEVTGDDCGQDGCHCRRVYLFEFLSCDIGLTQGTRILYRNRTIAQYRPGTKHWEQALKITEELLVKAVERVAATGDTWHPHDMTAAFMEIAKEDGCQEWDGSDVDWE